MGGIRPAFVHSVVWGLVLQKHRPLKERSLRLCKTITRWDILSAAIRFAWNFCFSGFVYRVFSNDIMLDPVREQREFLLLCSALRALCSSRCSASSFFTTASDLDLANDICYAEKSPIPLVKKRSSSRKIKCLPLVSNKVEILWPPSLLSAQSAGRRKTQKPVPSFEGCYAQQRPTLRRMI